MNVKVYAEGGGEAGELRTRCRRAFSSIFEKATLTGRMPRVVACGSRKAAFDRFCTALESRSEEDFIVLLVDSEGPVTQEAGPWAHLRARDGWIRPADATDENAHLMVQCMETWFLADRDNLADYFGHGFNPNALPARPEIEEVAKADLFGGLKNATRQTKKGEYGKGRHSFDILEQSDAAKILRASPHARRLIGTLRDKAA